MEDNKYYTPTIDEFHVGFEYEAFINNSWQSKVMNDYEDIIYFLFDMNAKTWLSINEGIVRVKYLDKEDLESLGFIKSKPRWHQHWNDFYKVYDSYSCNIRVNNIRNKTSISIHTISINNITKCLFIGTIKNKSELKVLLKQLGIEYGRGN